MRIDMNLFVHKKREELELGADRATNVTEGVIYAATGETVELN